MKKKGDVVTVRLSDVERMAIQFVQEVKRAHGYELNVSDVIRYCIASSAAKAAQIKGGDE